MTVYSDYVKDKSPFLFGLKWWQVVALVVTGFPVLGALSSQAWAAAFFLLMVWLVTLVVVVVPVHGRSFVGWLKAVAGYVLGGVMGWSAFRSKAARGATEDLERPDLPGPLASIEIHDAPPLGASMRRVAIIQNHASRTWAVTAAVVHPGIGMSDDLARRTLGDGEMHLLEHCIRTNLVDEVRFQVRTVTDDAAERQAWMASHMQDSAPDLAKIVVTDLERAMPRAAMRTEAFVTIVVPEGRIARPARDHGGGVKGRARVLAGLMDEVAGVLKNAMQMSSVVWLTGPELAEACRTGFAPGDRAALVEARLARERNAEVAADVPWAHAGPSGADQAARYYKHDAWASTSATIKLPDRGALMGALAPILTVNDSSERRSLLVSYPLESETAASRKAESGEFTADMAQDVRARLRMKTRARAARSEQHAKSVDAKLARGAGLIRPYAVTTVTVPGTDTVEEAGRALEASVRRAGFSPLRLDLSHDLGFAASTIPLGIGLHRTGF